jgi:Na+/melibiose symporter-like transporter
MKLGRRVAEQLKTNMTKSPVERSSGIGVTNAIASGVEFLGVLIVLMVIGWVAYRATGIIAIFIGFTIFGVVTTLAKMYFQTKAQLDRLDELGVERRTGAQDRRGRGLGGFLEANLDLDLDSEEEARDSGLCDPESSANLEAKPGREEDSERA